MIRDLTFTEAIFELDDCDEVNARISKEDLKALYDDAHCIPCNEDGKEDDTYIEGEIQFLFNKDTDVVDEILAFPVYEENEGIVNGDFIDVTTELWEYREDAAKFLNNNK